ncbi:SDR family NAD(P)-dependent oxidoreductase [Bradyrhizobium sp. 180]|uniref:SDR family NAD(P)-dependent oxidoreductase n=1 Tax=unclassified Bradyrhizobium TaxID=2631580 RepID=UPI001FF75B23|nr:MULTISPECIES: SDR family NAD(P)-dependent oxidoreductase [unclassified Bradyrhizobium]MCK1420382.1 SDR family NAD(P)-dependent oxidoreductase [Bradyrhizobium sp. CW12]MCK1491593.1 SDR family NAD(P)-dependent oxidoreductase [Bradyrhizobium sp. 180]MCK1531075.1 SDR family NAD(P)-dependent oxidoreductase [Bradyrhizobium sp. 182]MCK1596524.1 SDR family NAD(P)-dependent oxidoreductase [Bradyrhizobium sp. 164]MCK1618498.1 SDR family NAD(P)-dependent oxidoreductase [Bradyrhizobium sp. 159]
MRMKGKTVLITGSTDGVGRYVAGRLAKEGARVLIHGRDAARAKTLSDEIVEAGGIAPTFYQADLSSMSGTRALAEAVKRDHQRLDVLVSNAGIGSQNDGPQRQVSAEGHELRFAVNYLAGFLLVHLLLPLLKAAAPSRIVNVASLGQHPIEFDDVMITRGYSGSRAYAQSKLAQIMFTIDLAQELKGTGITVNALHPATYMNTTMVRAGGITPMSTVEQGGAAILHLVEGDDVADRSGLFFNGMNEARANPQAYDADARKRLRALSLELTGLSS